jgi:presenilin-like A22 family membrane protease
MKHSMQVTLLLLALFFATQVIGLYIANAYQAEEALPLDIERPELDEQTSFVSIFLFILLATVLALLLLKFELFTVWKFWFLLSVFFTLMISFAVFVHEYLAIALAILFALWRVFKPNVYVHNFTELFIYGALAAIFVPLLTVISMAILLILISIYDYIAVRKTKHMVTLAKSQGKAKVFAGLLVPYKKSVAILGGGDMGFPLLFAGVAMLQYDLGLLDWRTYLIPLFVGLMLFALFVKGDKKKFYPAMPYITLGCFLGLGLLLLVL